MDNKRIFSINKIAYILAHNIDVNWGIEDGLVYITVDKNISDLLMQYQNDEELHKFLNSFHMIKNKIKELNLVH